jgi:uroporphyrinogen decarboxylase
VFADILLLVEPLGVGLQFARGEGPVIHRPVRSEADVAALKPIDVASSVGSVFETVRLVRRALPPAVALIGFAGAPFTVASYVVEGGASRDYLHTKRLMYEAPAAWHRLMGVLADATADYLNGQIDAGAQVVQLFDSWVGALAPDDYRTYVLPHTRAVIRALRPGAPVIHFGTGTAGLLPLLREAGGDVIGLDWRVDLDRAWQTLGHDVGVQGNLDPAALLGPPAALRARVQAILDRAGGRPGHVFNLGHGVHQATPVDHVTALVDLVHELSAR